MKLRFEDFPGNRSKLLLLSEKLGFNTEVSTEVVFFVEIVVQLTTV